MPMGCEQSSLDSYDIQYLLSYQQYTSTLHGHQARQMGFWIIQFVGILSFLGSLTIILIFLSHPIIKQKKINTLVYYIAICDLCATLGWIVGESKDGTVKCWLQSMITSYFPLVSLFLTTLIAVILFAVIYKKTWSLLYLLHSSLSDRTILYSNLTFYLCWFIPFLLTLLPLTTNSYGNPGNSSGWCFLDRSPTHKWTLTFWIFFSFYLWFYLAVFLYFLLLWSITYRLSFVYGTLARLQNRCEVVTVQRIQGSIRKFIWYPLIIVICWLPSALWDINEALDESGGKMQSFFSRDWDSSYFNIFPAAQGFLTSIAFLSTNTDISQLLIQTFGFSSPSRTFSSLAASGAGDRDEEELEKDLCNGSNQSIWPFLREPLIQTASLSSRGEAGGYHWVRIPIDVSSSGYVESEEEEGTVSDGQGGERGESDEEIRSEGRGTGPRGARGGGGERGTLHPGGS
jgi:hypothetical protein